jgi:hypothetical protein
MQPSSLPPNQNAAFRQPDVTPARVVFDEQGTSALEVHPHTPDSDIVLEGLYRVIGEGPELTADRQERIETLMANLRGKVRYNPAIHGEHAANPQSIKRQETGPILIEGDEWKLVSRGLTRMMHESNDTGATDLQNRIDTARTKYISSKKQEAAQLDHKEEARRERTGSVSVRVRPPLPAQPVLTQSKLDIPFARMPQD